MDYVEQIMKLHPCDDSSKWMLQKRSEGASFWQAWTACANAEWLIWLVAKLHAPGDLGSFEALRACVAAYRAVAGYTVWCTDLSVAGLSSKLHIYAAPPLMVMELLFAGKLDTQSAAQLLCPQRDVLYSIGAEAWAHQALDVDEAVQGNRDSVILSSLASITSLVGEHGVRGLYVADTYAYAMIGTPLSYADRASHAVLKLLEVLDRDPVRLAKLTRVIRDSIDFSKVEERLMKL